jgi:hypothetical protein
MTTPFPYKRARKELEPLVERTREQLSGGWELESVLQELRSNGYGLSDSIAITMDATGMLHRDAKWAVCRSQTWSDVFPDVVELHESLERALDELTREQRPPRVGAG